MLTAKKISGEKAEYLACRYLRNHGYKIIERNYRSGKAEIDIIARQQNLLVFVEVRSLRSCRYGFPEQTISLNKEKTILQGAEDYIFQVNWMGEIRFDIISIEWSSDKKLEHFQDVFS